MEQFRTLTLLQLQQTVTRLVTVPETQMVWVTAELSDVAVRGGHCYMELLQKDPDRGTIVAKSRAVVWANIWPRFEAYFRNATGQAFTTGIKVMVRVSVSYHAVFGLTLTVSSVNPEYTMGDLLKRRKEILQRLEKEGILELNRQLEWPEPAQRIAIISAPGAAGYGDFMNQLLHNPRRLRFMCRLFPAVMQGDRTSPSIISAINDIARSPVPWDCVVMIRGGGASSDLAAFDDYNLAAAVARCPVPVIIGIGHERDVTVLDNVANMRVKTPTAAAEWLIKHNAELLDRLRSTVAAIMQTANDRIAGFRTHAAYLGGLIPALSTSSLTRASERLNTRSLTLASVSARRISPAIAKTDNISASLSTAVRSIIDRSRMKLDNYTTLAEALAPEATLRRGYTITRVNGTIVTSSAQVPAGATIITTTADGSVSSTVTSVNR